MKRFGATVLCDLRLQARNGFYTATVFVLALVALGLSRLPRVDWGWLLPPIVLLYMNVTAFYFCGALVLLEKDDGAFVTRAVSPPATALYFGSKTLTLAALAVAESLVLVTLLYGLRFRPLPFVGGVAAAAGLYVLVGFLAAARYDTLEQYLLPSVAYGAAASLPLVTGLAHWESDWMMVHPMQAALTVLRASFESVQPWRLLYSLGYVCVWLAVLYLLCRRSHRRLALRALEA